MKRQFLFLSKRHDYNRVCLFQQVEFSRNVKQFLNPWSSFQYLSTFICPISLNKCCNQEKQTFCQDTGISVEFMVIERYLMDGEILSLDNFKIIERVRKTFPVIGQCVINYGKGGERNEFFPLSDYVLFYSSFIFLPFHIDK